ncbi:MAG: diguanylate cyclase [Campylobacteraceae bacterium]|nr:diguanylate cyclase [Campylobacteraceae bacterium]
MVEKSLLYDCREKAIREVAEKIRINFMNKIIPAGSETISKTISMGLSYFPKDLDDCIKFSDLALYNAKNTGRNKVVKYIKDFSKTTLT